MNERLATQLHRRPMFFALLLASLAAPAGAMQTIVAKTGDAAPGLSGLSFAGGFYYGQLNNAGQMVYLAWLSNGTSSFSSLWLDHTLIAKAGDAAPGLSGVSYGAVDTPALNASGQVAFYSTLTGTGVTTGNDQAIWRNGALIAREGNATSYGSGVNLGGVSSYPKINDAGQVSYQSWLTGTDVTTSNDTAIWRSGSLVGREGSAAPGLTGVSYGHFSAAAPISNAGQLAYYNGLTGTGVISSNNESIWRSGSLVVREGDTAPGLSGLSYGSLGYPQMNAYGQVAYYSYLTGTGIDGSNDVALWRDDALVAREGNPTYVWSGVSYGDIYSTFKVNDVGQLAYYTTLTGSGVDGSKNEALWRSGTPVAREGDPAPYLAGVSYGSLNYSPQINAGGQLLYGSNLTGTSVTASNNYALWIGDGGGDAILVARKGDALAGSTITNLTFADGAINDYGQVAYMAYLANGVYAQMLFTPELHWRRTYGSSWDTAGNWSAGISPAALHPVVIDPAASLTVTGPSTDRTVKSLQLGGGNGQATLRLSSGVITVTEGPLLVQTSGILTGDGKLNAAVESYGTVQAQNVTLSGDLNNYGLVAGNGRINARLVNQAGGEVRVGGGEFLRLGGSGLAHSSLGQVEVAGGQLQSDGSFTNQSSGRVLLNDGSVRFLGGLINHGQVLVTFGESSLFGNITNESAGKLIVSQGALTTLYDTFTNKGTLRVSQGGAATFFGVLKGNTTTGTGSVRLEGGWTPGFSPILATVTNELYLDSELEMELYGTTPGSCDATAGMGCHDKLIFENIIDLGTSSGLKVTLLDGYLPDAGDSYDLFDWGSQRSGVFGYLNLPTLDPSLFWDTSQLYTEGVLSVRAVPLPGAIWLFASALGLAGLRFSRRRQH